MRYSLQKETIREIVKSTDSHPTADWIFQRAKRKIPNISLGTVYRNLKHLAAEGFLR
ncbi:MAG TPA: transcriptional repressor, partial [Candidatus Marinimicrobia bacterium]|nr:transcriptional repressor [Candidatus Neomarinimicrobiota bacterium]